MPHRLFSVLSLLSLALFIAFTAMWIRSNYHSENVRFRSDVAAGHYDDYSIGYYVGIFVISADHYRFAPDARTAFIQSALRGREPTREDGRVHYSSSRVDPRDRSMARAAQSQELMWGVGFETEEATNVWDIQGLTSQHWVLMLPCWAPAAAAAILPALWVRRWQRRRRHEIRQRRGLCPRCGYDLRGTPDRCPECGVAAPPAPPATASVTSGYCLSCWG